MHAQLLEGVGGGGGGLCTPWRWTCEGLHLVQIDANSMHETPANTCSARRRNAFTWAKQAQVKHALKQRSQASSMQVTKHR